ncbi:hypothetical protein GCM10022255_046910 [Dactylosporangium darangshiense]|uniref:Uncharacterized protein n=1 Tax=Dactylosporangium darangshiense TaxID=579108 RepID=A0ABP8DBI8_9ACTN
MPDTLLLQRLDIGGVIDRLAADVRAGRLPAGMPYRHVNGFTKIVAAEYPDGSRLTLHYWPAGPLGGEHVSRPHDHRFPFRSVLLGGRQHFVELEEGEGRAANWRRFSYRPYAGGRIAHVAYSGTVALDPMRVVERAPLQGQYVTTSTIVHQAVTDRRQACATLVLRGPRERLRSRVYYRPDEPPPRGGLQLGRRLDRAEVVRQLEDIAAMIA